VEQILGPALLTIGVWVGITESLTPFAGVGVNVVTAGIKDRLHWKWSAGLAGVAVIAIAALVVNQNIALANLRSNMLDQFIRMERLVGEGPIKKTKK
jgi:hypothetical protein